MNNKYGFDALRAQAEAGGIQRDIAKEGISADFDEYIRQQDYDYKQLQFLHSLLQGMPLTAQSYQYQEPSTVDQLTDAGIDLQTVLDWIGANVPADSGESE